MNLILLGPPGAGKGTQAEKISDNFGIPHVSTGDIFRENLSKETELGLKAKEYMDRGELVPDEVVIGIVDDRLQAGDCNDGFILDGFPRTVVQADALKKILRETGRQIEHVLNIQVPDGVVIERLTARRTCADCGAVYHLQFNTPRNDNRCDSCGGELYQREDDREQTIRARLEEYNKKTKPLIDYYRSEGLLREIDGSVSEEEVFGSIHAVIEPGMGE
jgi:adenylate kinase